MTGLSPAARELLLDRGDVVNARTLILATGVSWRRLAIDDLDRLIGKGVYYGAARSEASATHGHDIHLIGAGNSAGQAALAFANHARKVTLVVRGESLESSMSHYLIEQLRSKSNIAVQSGAQIQAVHGDTHLTAIDIHDGASKQVRRHDCGALFIFIGADAETEWLPADIARNTRGYVLTGDDINKAGRWSHSRDPYLLETSVLGVFACGSAVEPGQARCLGGRRGQHGDRLHSPVSSPGGPITAQPELAGADGAAAFHVSLVSGYLCINVVVFFHTSPNLFVTKT